MKRYILIVAAVALATVSCSRNYDVNPTGEGAEIGFGTWAENLTKAPLTGFAANDEFDVYGYKVNSGTNTTVFDGDDVKYDGSKWDYSPARYWDPSATSYVFFASFPKDLLTTAPAQTGLFVSNELAYDGRDEKLLIAQKKTVETAHFGEEVPIVFKHTGALVDFKFKKHNDLAKSKVTVTAFSLANIDTKGKFTVASYDGTTNDPVGKTVSEVAGLGWEVAETPVKNADAAPYKITSNVALAAETGTTTATAADLLTNLVIMPQKFTTGEGAQTFTIAYTIEDENGIVNTYTPAAIKLGTFDKSDPNPTPGDPANNPSDYIGAWMPGIHYTYYITINANKIVFTASIADWVTTAATGHHYLLN